MINNKKPSAFAVLKDCKKDFWLTNFIQFFEGFGYFSLIHIFALYLFKYCGFSDADSTFWVGMFTLFISVFLMAMGSVCDIIGLKRTYTIGFAILITGRLILGYGTDFGTGFMDFNQESSGFLIQGGILIMAFGTAFMSPCIQASIRRFTTLRSRATAFNFYYAFMNLGALIAGYFIVDKLREVYGDTDGLQVIVNVGTLFYVLAYILTRFVNEDYYAVPEERVDKKDIVQRRPLQLIGEVVRERAFQKLLIFLCLTLGVRLVFTIQFLVMPQYYTRTSGDDFAIGTIQSLNPFIIIFGLIAAIPFLNKFTTVNLMLYGMAISAFSLVFMAIPAEWYFIFPGIDTLGQAYFVAIVLQIVVFAIGEVLFSPRFSEYVARVAPKDKVASYMSLAGLPMFIAKPINGVIGGLLVGHLCYDGITTKMETGHIGFWQSPEFMWIIYLGMAVISPIAIFFTKKMFESADNDHAIAPDKDKDDKDDSAEENSNEKTSKSAV